MDESDFPHPGFKRINIDHMLTLQVIVTPSTKALTGLMNASNRRKDMQGNGKSRGQSARRESAEVLHF